jgi:hypothetical protein
MPLFALATGFAVITLVMREEHGSLVPLGTITLSARVANGVAAYGWYLSSTFCPWQLAVLYPHPYGNWSLPAALAGKAVLLLITLLCLAQASRRPWLITGWLWFVGTLVPVIGFAQGGWQAWADRFSYWPHIGLFVAITYGLAELIDRFHIPAWVPGTVGALVLGGLGMLTWAQVGYWRNALTLWEHAVAVTWDNDRAHQHLSTYYRNHGRIEEADFHLTEAGRIQFERRQASKTVR